MNSQSSIRATASFFQKIFFFVCITQRTEWLSNFISMLLGKEFLVRVEFLSRFLVHKKILISFFLEKQGVVSKFEGSPIFV